VTAPNDPRPAETPSDSRTRIIRRAPTGPIPTIPTTPTTQIPRQPASGEATQSAPPVRTSAPADEPASRTEVAACAVAIVSGWATSVVATDLIAGWWRTDRLFCIAVAFLAIVFASTTITGVIMLLQHRPLGRYLIAAGAVVGVLTYGGVFIAGAHVAWIVYTLWVLPVASVVLAFYPQITEFAEQRIGSRRR
jgi:acyl dehydratase